MKKKKRGLLIFSILVIVITIGGKFVSEWFDIKASAVAKLLFIVPIVLIYLVYIIVSELRKKKNKA